MKLSNEPLVRFLQKMIRVAVRAMAILITLVIFYGVIDIVYLVYKQMMSSPKYLLGINDLLEIFGAFMAVLIAIEIFINITIYLKSEAIHVKIVIATALVAIARKVIVFDFDKLSPAYIWSTALVIIALSAAYWWIGVKGQGELDSEEAPL